MKTKKPKPESNLNKSIKITRQLVDLLMELDSLELYDVNVDDEINKFSKLKAYLELEALNEEKA